MTQAPTPGPLSAEDVNRECKACGAFKPDRDAVCTFCGLAPTAPVEASGSEREHGPKCWGGTSFSDEMAHCYCGSTDLRPQPSGKTREAVGWITIFKHHLGASSLHEVVKEYIIQHAHPSLGGGEACKGCGEVEEALSCLADYDHTGRLERAVRSALRQQATQEADAGREAIRKVIHELWQLLDDGETRADGTVTIDQERYQEVSKAMDDLEALVPDSAGPFWGGFPVNYFWGLK